MHSGFIFTLFWWGTLLLFLIQGVFTLLDGLKHKNSLYLSSLTFSILFWLIILKLADLHLSTRLTLFINQLAFVTPLLTAWFILLFFQSILLWKIKIRSRFFKVFQIIKIIGALLSVVITLLIFVTKRIVRDVLWTNGYNNVTKGDLYFIYLLIAFLPIILNVLLYIILLREARKRKSLAIGLNITRATWLLFTTLLAVVGIIVTNIILPLYTKSSAYTSLSVIPLGLWLILINIFSKTTIFLPFNTILKFIARVFIISILLFIPIQIFFNASYILAVLYALTFSTIALITDGLLSKIMFLKSTDNFKELSRYFSKVVNLEKIQNLALKILKERLGFERGSFIPYEKLKNSLPHMPNLKTTKHSIYFSVDVYNTTNANQDQPIYQWMIKQSIDILIVFNVDKQPFIIALSKRHVNAPPTTADVEFIYAFIDIISASISRALLYHKLNDFNKQLTQKIKERTLHLTQANKKLKQIINKLNILYKTVKKSDEAKSTFISIASHQLRTPISIIKNYTDIVLSEVAGPLTDEQKAMLKRIKDTSVRLASIVTDILQTSRIERGKFRLNLSSIKVSQLAQEVFEQNKELAHKRNIDYRLFVTNDAKNLIIQGDRDKLFEAYANLVDNAIQYTKSQNGIVHQFLYTINHEWVVYAVKDNGIGVPKDKQDKLFHKFTRLENARKVRPDGTGIGLYLVKEIVDSHGGKIWLESEEGKGSTFYIAIPLKLPDDVQRNALSIDINKIDSKS